MENYPGNRPDAALGLDEAIERARVDLAREEAEERERLRQAHEARVQANTEAFRQREEVKRETQRVQEAGRDFATRARALGIPPVELPARYNQHYSRWSKEYVWKDITVAAWMIRAPIHYPPSDHWSYVPPPNVPGVFVADTVSRRAYGVADGTVFVDCGSWPPPREWAEFQPGQAENLIALMGRRLVELS